jgi:hypothetical protein
MDPHAREHFSAHREPPRLLDVWILKELLDMLCLYPQHEVLLWRGRVPWELSGGGHALAQHVLRPESTYAL